MDFEILQRECEERGKECRRNAAAGAKPETLLWESLQTPPYYVQMSHVHVLTCAVYWMCCVNASLSVEVMCEVLWRLFGGLGELCWEVLGECWTDLGSKQRMINRQKLKRVYKDLLNPWKTKVVPMLVVRLGRSVMSVRGRSGLSGREGHLVEHVDSCLSNTAQMLPQQPASKRNLVVQMFSEVVNWFWTKGLSYKTLPNPLHKTHKLASTTS